MRWKFIFFFHKAEEFSEVASLIPIAYIQQSPRYSFFFIFSVSSKSSTSSVSCVMGMWIPEVHTNAFTHIDKMYCNFFFHKSKAWAWEQLSYSDLDWPRDIRVWKTASEFASTTPTAIIAGWSSQYWGNKQTIVNLTIHPYACTMHCWE